MDTLEWKKSEWYNDCVREMSQPHPVNAIETGNGFIKYSPVVQYNSETHLNEYAIKSEMKVNMRSNTIAEYLVKKIEWIEPPHSNPVRGYIDLSNIETDDYAMIKVDIRWRTSNREQSNVYLTKIKDLIATINNEISEFNDKELPILMRDYQRVCDEISELRKEGKYMIRKSNVNIDAMSTALTQINEEISEIFRNLDPKIIIYSDGSWEIITDIGSYPKECSDESEDEFVDLSGDLMGLSEFLKNPALGGVDFYYPKLASDLVD